MTTTTPDTAGARAASEVGYRHILVPLDGSDFAAEALDTAAVLAHRFGAQLDAVEVVTTRGQLDQLGALAQLGSSGAQLRTSTSSTC